jgi:hypothetical protein
MSECDLGRGPAWLGIGAPRSGTTWLTQLLVQHPQLKFVTNGRKEQQALHLVADGQLAEQEYLDLFDAPGCRGEFTPFYLRAISVPPIAARICSADTPFIVILRDPVERFASGMRRQTNMPRRTRGAASEKWFRAGLAVALWAGMYADQLDVWANFVGRDRLLVMTYEWAVNEPQAACERVWSALDLEPVAVQPDLIEVPHTTAGDEWDWSDGMRMAATQLYTPQVDRLASDWGMDVSPWTNFR